MTSKRRTGLTDTHPDAEEVQIACYRRMSVSQRCETARSLTRAGFAQSYRAVNEADPQMSEAGID